MSMKELAEHIIYVAHKNKKSITNNIELKT